MYLRIHHAAGARRIVARRKATERKKAKETENSKHLVFPADSAGMYINETELNIGRPRVDAGGSATQNDVKQTRMPHAAPLMVMVGRPTPDEVQRWQAKAWA